MLGAIEDFPVFPWSSGNLVIRPLVVTFLGCVELPGPYPANGAQNDWRQNIRSKVLSCSLNAVQQRLPTQTLP